MSEKIQKIMARAGICSRRQAEQLIDEGKVTKNGRPVKLGDRAEPGDKLKYLNKTFDLADLLEKDFYIIAYHKKVGEVCTRSDPEGRPTIFNSLPKLKNQSWVSVGRLDINTSGLLLLTTNGELANALMHPSNQVVREYAVRVKGQVSDNMLQNMVKGVELEDGKARFEDIVESDEATGSNRWYHVVIVEGRKREVRRLWESQGVTVSRLKRVRYGDYIMPSKIKQGMWLSITRAEAKKLFENAGLPWPHEKAPSKFGYLEKSAAQQQRPRQDRRGGAKTGGRPHRSRK